jgi:molybdopterin molybdotransferase
MHEFEEACELIFKNTQTIGTEDRPIEDAVACALAEDVVSPIDVSPFRSSAMDGFAVKSSWLENCTKDNPRLLPVGSTTFAGDSSSQVDTASQALKIMTGARVPDEYDAVVMIEDTEFDQDTVRFFKPVKPGKNIRSAGEDITRGQKLYSEGTVLNRLDIGILATIGFRSVVTFKKPSMVIIGTGNELLEPGVELTEGKIYDSNSYTILSLASPYCSKAESIRRVPDRKEELQKVLNSQHDVIVTSGGVSVGDRDLVVKMAEASGWQTVFHKARIKPGKPIYFAVRGKQVLFGLPGNPLSATVTFCMFVATALKKMSGFANYRLQKRSVAMKPESFRKCKRVLIWPGALYVEEGRHLARYSAKKSSAALTALQGTDGLIIQYSDDPDSRDGKVDFIPWNQVLI